MIRNFGNFATSQPIFFESFIMMSSMDEPKIIFESRDFVAVVKPAGLLVHRVRVSAAKMRSGRMDEARRTEATLADLLVARYPEMARVGDDPAYRPGIVHRLDKETSGVMVVVRTQEAFERLKALFQSHAMKKTYLALVVGVPDPAKGTIDRPIGIRNGTLKRSVHVKQMAKEAVTDYEVKEKSGIPNAGPEEDGYALVEARPRTGRTHQIRVHLASIGHPIVGDRLYGGKRAVEPGAFGNAPRLMLHAASLEWDDGAGNGFAFEAPPPDDFNQVIHSVFHR